MYIINGAFAAPTKAALVNVIRSANKGGEYFAALSLALYVLKGDPANVKGACEEFLATNADCRLKVSSLARYCGSGKRYLALEPAARQSATEIGISKGQREFRTAIGETVSESVPPNAEQRFDSIVKAMIEVEAQAKTENDEITAILALTMLDALTAKNAALKTAMLAAVRGAGGAVPGPFAVPPVDVKIDVPVLEIAA